MRGPQSGQREGKEKAEIRRTPHGQRHGKIICPNKLRRSGAPHVPERCPRRTPACSVVVQKLRKSCRRVAQGAEILTNSCRSWQPSARFGPNLPDCGQNWAKDGRHIGPNTAHMGEAWSKLAGLGPNLPSVADTATAALSLRSHGGAIRARRRVLRPTPQPPRHGQCLNGSTPAPLKLNNLATLYASDTHDGMLPQSHMAPSTRYTPHKKTLNECVNVHIAHTCAPAISIVSFIPEPTSRHPKRYFQRRCRSRQQRRGRRWPECRLGRRDGASGAPDVTP